MPRTRGSTEVDHEGAACVAHDVALVQVVMADPVRMQQADGPVDLSDLVRLKCEAAALEECVDSPSVGLHDPALRVCPLILAPSARRGGLEARELPVAPARGSGRGGTENQRFQRV